MPDATDNVANIFESEITGQPPKSVGQAGDFTDQPLFNTSPMEGEDSDEDGVPPSAPPKRSAKPKEPESDVDDDFGDEGEIDPPDDEGSEDDEAGDPDDDEEREASARKPVDGYDPNTEVEVKVDGETQKVTIREALDGYIRTKTFNQRMNKLSEETQTVQRDRMSYAEALVKQKNALDQVLAEMDALAVKEPDWDALAKESPELMVKQKILWDRYREGRASLEKQREENLQTQRNEYNRSLGEHIAKESDKLVKKYPHWSDPKAKGRDQEAMKKTAMKAGFTEREVESVYDSRMVEILMKAARYDRLSSKKLVPNRKSTTKPMPSGARSGRAASQDGTLARRHAQYGSVDTATPLFERILASEG